MMCKNLYNIGILNSCTEHTQTQTQALFFVFYTHTESGYTPLDDYHHITIPVSTSHHIVDLMKNYMYVLKDI